MRSSLIPSGSCGILTAFLALASPLSAQLSFSEDTFSDAVWNLTTFVYDVGSGSATASQRATGGNPDSNRQLNTVTTIVTNNVPSGTFASNSLNGASFDPSLFSSAVTLDFSVDYTHLATNSTGGGGGGGHTIRFLVVQNGKHYVSTTLQGTGQGASWSNFSSAGLVASNFIEVDTTQQFGLDFSSHPDFSPGGAPVLLGFTVASSTGAAAPAFTEDITTAYDNFSVDVNGTFRKTQPSSLAWLGSAGDFPDCLGYTPFNTADVEVPTLSGGAMTLSTDSVAEIMGYRMDGDQLQFPAQTIVDFALQMSASSSNFPQRRGAVVGVAPAQNVLINLWIGIDEVFFTNGSDIVVDRYDTGDDPTFDTNDAFHLYRIEVDGTTAGSAVRLYQDDVLIMTAATSASGGVGLFTPPRITFGEGTGAETGTSIWGSFAHNAYLAPNISQTILVQHSGATDPSTEGFTNTDSGIGVTEGQIFNDLGSGFDAWFINDGSLALGSAIVYRSETFDSATLALAETYGWSLIARVRIPVGSVGAFPAMATSFFNGDRGFSMLFDRESDGDPRIELSGGPSTVIELAGDQTHIYYELKYDPITQSADLFANGIKILSNYSGFVSGAPARINWGATASNGSGQGNFSIVAWGLNTSPVFEPDFSGPELTIDYLGILQESTNLLNWVDIDPQPVSPYQVVPAGGSKYFRLKP